MATRLVANLIKRLKFGFLLVPLPWALGDLQGSPDPKHGAVLGLQRFERSQHTTKRKMLRAHTWETML